jgi:hypothetical protein
MVYNQQQTKMNNLNDKRVRDAIVTLLNNEEFNECDIDYDAGGIIWNEKNQTLVAPITDKNYEKELIDWRVSAVIHCGNHFTWVATGRAAWNVEVEVDDNFNKFEQLLEAIEAMEAKREKREYLYSEEEDDEEEEDLPHCDADCCENTENLKTGMGWNRYYIWNSNDRPQFSEKMFCPDCYDEFTNTDCYECGKSIPNGKEVVLSFDGKESCIPCCVGMSCCPKGHYGGQYGCDFCASSYEIEYLLSENKEIFNGKYCAEKHYRMLKCS